MRELFSVTLRVWRQSPCVVVCSHWERAWLLRGAGPPRAPALPRAPYRVRALRRRAAQHRGSETPAWGAPLSRLVSAEPL